MGFPGRSAVPTQAHNLGKDGDEHPERPHDGGNDDVHALAVGGGRGEIEAETAIDDTHSHTNAAVEDVEI